jgi:hypothetical protein
MCGQAPLGAEEGLITYTLDIDHVDDDKTNDDPINLQLCCRHCNTIKENVRRPRRRNTLTTTDPSKEFQRSTVDPSKEFQRSTVDPSKEFKEALLSSREHGKPEGVCVSDSFKEPDSTSDMAKMMARESPNTLIYKEALPYRDERASPEMQANAVYVPKFERWLLGYIANYGFIPKKEAIASGARISGCNVLTAQRYLVSLTSREGPLIEGRDEVGQIMVYPKARFRKE